MKLMIVDDSLVIRNKINRTLLAKFNGVLRAENGVQAIELVISEKPDVITMDLTMPKMGGVEAIQQIIGIAPSTHILVVSALADKATAISALSYGANGFLCKPFTEHELSSAIERIIDIELS
ncbi:response regulator [Arenicella sp. 4NH20-0111]|uniref:response regulator n=1 Tax=Arenicella sp. 4NH20-0111 TaxID=3127648 RepID=UPI0031082F09